MSKRAFNRTFDALPRVFAFTAEFYEQAGVTPADRRPIDFAIEEIFTNMVKYHPEASGDIEIELERRDGAAHVVLTDRDVDRFDITAVEAPDVTASIEDRKVGGLGLFLTRHLMTSVDYEYADRTSRILLTKELS